MEALCCLGLLALPLTAAVFYRIGLRKGKSGFSAVGSAGAKNALETARLRDRVDLLSRQLRFAQSIRQTEDAERAEERADPNAPPREAASTQTGRRRERASTQADPQSSAADAGGPSAARLSENQSETPPNEAAKQTGQLPGGQETEQEYHERIRGGAKAAGQLPGGASRKALWVFCVLFCLTVAAPAPLHQIFGGGAPPLPKKPTLAEINAYEDALEESSPLSETVRPAMQRVLARLGAPSGDALIGGNGRLFFEPDIQHTLGKPFPIEPPLQAILHFREQLQRRGIQLLLLPIPPKSAVEADRYAKRPVREPLLRNPAYAELAKRLRDENVPLLDDPPETFLKTDTHWTPEAMRAAAQRTAQWIQQWNARENNARENEENAPLSTQKTAYTRGKQTVQGTGDLAAMLNASIPKETALIEPIFQPDGSPWEPTRNAEILLLGDSFSNIYSLEEMTWGAAAGFAEQLSYELQRPLDRIVLNQGGSRASRRELARNPSRLENARIVVWQFAARELSWGEWERIELPDSSAAPETKTAQAVRAAGTVLEIAQPPPLNSTPYPDALIAVRLTDIAPQDPDGAALPDEAVVFVWGMRGRRHTEWAERKPGDAVQLLLTPWAAAEAQYGRYSRVELDSEEAWLLDLYWGESRAEENGIDE